MYAGNLGLKHFPSWTQGLAWACVISVKAYEMRWVQVDPVQQPVPIGYLQRVYDRPFVEEAGRAHF